VTSGIAVCESERTCVGSGGGLPNRLELYT
jgi:hypothetical protein